MTKEEDKNARGKNDIRVWDDIRKKVEDLRYGSVNISVQDGKIVQVETSSKTRY